MMMGQSERSDALNSGMVREVGMDLGRRNVLKRKLISWIQWTRDHVK